MKNLEKKIWAKGGTVTFVFANGAQCTLDMQQKMLIRQYGEKVERISLDEFGDDFEDVVKAVEATGL